MRTIIEVTQSECECSTLIATPLALSYHIRAKVELKPAIGKRLIISINPSLNSICGEELIYDGSKLPEDMVEDWLMEILRPNQRLIKYDIISSNKEEHKIIINN